MSSLSSMVPLPEVGNVSSTIVVSDAIVPVGVDPAELSVNLRAFEAFRIVSGVGNISIELDNYISGPKPFVETEVKYDSYSVMGKPDATLAINAYGMNLESRLNHADYLDPDTQANVINKAVRAGLGAAAVGANMDGMKKLRSGLHVVTASSFGVAGKFLLDTEPAPAFVASSVLTSLIYTAQVGVHEAMLRYSHNQPQPFRHALEALRSYRFAVTSGVSPLRIARGMVAARTGNFIVPTSSVA